MSFGSVSNQPFNPTGKSPGDGLGQAIGSAAGNAISGAIFGQNAQGPLSSLTRQIPNMAINSVANLPGAPMTPQQNVNQSQASGGILKMRQQPPMLGQQPGGKSGGGGMQFGNGKSGGGYNSGGGGKYTTGGPAIEQPGFDEMPNVDYHNSWPNYSQTGDGTGGTPDYRTFNV